jgi:hypothetical protein
MVFFGALLGLGNPTRKVMMMVFVFLSQTGFGWAQMLSITFIQFGVPQVELGVSGGLAGVSRFGKSFSAAVSGFWFRYCALGFSKARCVDKCVCVLSLLTIVLAGGAIAISVYSTILSNTLTTWMTRLIPSAVLPLGLPSSSLASLMTALPQGSAALASVPGITPSIMAAAGAALQESYVHALRVTALSSLSFGVIAIVACCLCNDIGHKMDDRIEVFLENDEFADKNRFH